VLAYLEGHQIPTKIMAPLLDQDTRWLLEVLTAQTADRRPATEENCTPQSGEITRPVEPLPQPQA